MVLAEIYLKLGDLQAAMHALEQSLEISPKNVQVNNVAFYSLIKIHVAFLGSPAFGHCGFDA